MQAKINVIFYSYFTFSLNRIINVSTLKIPSCFFLFVSSSSTERRVGDRNRQSRSGGGISLCPRTAQTRQTRINTNGILINISIIYIYNIYIIMCVCNEPLRIRSRGRFHYRHVRKLI